MAIVDLKQISKTQPMREGEIDTVDTVNAVLGNFPIGTADIADGAVTNAKLAADAVTTDKILDGTITTADLNVDTQNLLSFLASMPAIQYGTSNSVDIDSNGYADVTVSFSAAKTEAPVVICGIQHDSGNLNCVVTQVTNLQFAARIYNLGATSVTGVALDYITLSRRQ